MGRADEELSIQQLKQGLSAYVSHVAEKGSTYLISKHGRPVARLVPAVEPDVREPEEAGGIELGPLIPGKRLDRLLEILAEDRAGGADR